MIADFQTFAAKMQHLSPGDLADVQRAFDFAVHAHEEQKREDGTPYVTHPIAVAEIVAGWQADKDTIIAALLHDTLEDTAVKKEDILFHFGRRVALLVDGITKFSQADLSVDLPLDRKIETIRKLFDVMRLDMRSIIIKLADRLHNIETIANLPTVERRRKFAIETLTVYYKIAFHLGMRDVRRTYAEFSVPYAYDEGPKEREIRNRLCDENALMPATVERELAHAGSEHVLSVYLQPRNLCIFHNRIARGAGTPVAEDAFSIVVMVKTEDACYRLLKTIHTLYRPVSGHFRDYIAAPSDAGYQSLHTFVTLASGTVIEVRIRTPEMYEQATKGIALLLFSATGSLPSTFSWLRRSAAIDLQTRDSSSAFWEAIESDVLKETISITVDRKRISIPRGSTALDAAYSVYNGRAGFVRLLTLGGRTVPLSETLKEDDDVHVEFAPREQATFDWLQIVATKHAQMHIVDVLKRMSRSEKVALGSSLLQKELDHYGKGLGQDLSRTQCQHAADHFRRQHFDDVLAMVGEGLLRARDVFFYLYPDRRRWAIFHRTIRRYPFRLHVTGREMRQQDVLSHLQGVLRMTEVTVTDTKVSHNGKTNHFDLTIAGSCQDRLQFADFIDQLERQDWTLSVQALISFTQRAILVTAFILAFTVAFLDIILFPRYQQAIISLPIVIRYIVQSLPLVPILVANYYLLRLLRQYVARMRNERWFLGVGLVLNMVGLMVLVLRIAFLHGTQDSLLPLILVFTVSLGYMAYTFFQTDALFAPFDQRLAQPIPKHEWLVLRRKKTIGYIIRLAAVLIWGLEPIYIRYTPANSLSPFLRTFLLGVGVIVPSLIIYVCKQWIQTRRLPSFTLRYNGVFVVLVIGQIGYMYFKNASLLYTSGTNLLLFNNFAPLLGLIIAAFFWRKDIAYFRSPRTMLWIFILAMTAGIGSSLLIYSNAGADPSWTLIGDILAMISTFFDVLLSIGQIQYIKQFTRTDGALLNLHIFFYLLIFTAPVVIVSRIIGASLFVGLTPMTLLFGLGIGLFVGFGQLLNYEAFKRIDGYLAYMMFNLSVLITFVIEAFFIHSVHPTMLLFLSGALIISASVIAEFINSRAQRKGI